LIFCSAVARFVPYENDACTTEALVVLVAVVDSSPGTPWMAASMGVDTSLFTTSGDAPGYVETMISAGNSIDGMSSCLRFVRARPPKIAATIVMSAMRARFFRLSTARFDTDAFGGRGAEGRARRRPQRDTRMYRVQYSMAPIAAP